MDSRVLPTIQGALTEAAPHLARIAKFLWDNPEIGLTEVKAHDALTQLLEELGFSVEPYAVLPTGFVASFSSSPSVPELRPHVAVMCEFDALPDVGHACGHNLIAATAVGAGLAVRAAMIACGIEGRVSVFGTPAEENAGGKVDFINAGRLRDVDAAMMVHPCGGSKNFVECTFNARTDLTVTFTGKATHAASTPWEGINALDAAVLTYQNVSALRQHIPRDWRVGAVITKGGRAANVIPDSTEMQFTLRTPLLKEMKDLGRKVRSCIDGAAVASGCSASIIILDHPYKDMRANQTLCGVFKANAEMIGTKFEDQMSIAGSTDMGNVCYEVPSIHPVFQIGSSAECHERQFTKDTGSEASEKFVIEEATIMALTAIDVLTNRQLREEMWREFELLKSSQ